MNKEILANLQELLAGQKEFDSELYASKGRSQEVSLKEGKLENLDFSCYEGMGLRIFKDDKTAFAYSNCVCEAELNKLFEKTKHIIEFAQPDSNRTLPQIGSDGGTGAEDLQIYDKDLFNNTSSEIINLLESESAKAKKLDPRIKSVLRAGYSQSEGSCALMNSRGMLKQESSTYAGCGISVIADSGGDIQTGSSHISKRFFKDIDFGFPTKEAVWTACALLNAGKAGSGKRSVLMHPSVAIEFMDLVASALSADSVQKNRSFLGGLVGKKAASEKFSMIDDALMLKGLATSHFDDEGVPCGKIDVFKDGVLENLFYDSYTANKEHKISTGNASRGSFKGVPSPGPSNLYIVPGSKTPDEIIKNIKNGIYLLEVMGMHMADTISGDFSIGISGVTIENGVVGGAVRGITLAGNLKQLLANVAEVGNDIIFYGGFGSPSILIDDLMVGG